MCTYVWEGDRKEMSISVRRFFLSDQSNYYELIRMTSKRSAHCRSNQNRQKYTVDNLLVTIPCLNISFGINIMYHMLPVFFSFLSSLVPPFSLSHTFLDFYDTLIWPHGG